MKITIFAPKSEFTKDQQKRLFSLGQIVCTDSRREYKLEDLIRLAKGSDIIAPDPDNFGGFEKAKQRLARLIESLPKLKGIALSTTSYGWVDLDYCKKNKIPVVNIPGFSREAVAEHTLALLLNLAKRIIVTDRKTQKHQYKLEMGFELKDKTLGIIGMGSIGSRVAELSRGIGMNVIAYNRSPKKVKGVGMVSLDKLLKQSDAVAIHVTHSEENNGLIGKKEITKMKDGVIIVNTADREIVNEQAMAEAIKSGKVYGYAYEAEDLTYGPLADLENAVGIQGFGWYTKEALQRLVEIWITNIKAMVRGHPQNLVK